MTKKSQGSICPRRWGAALLCMFPLALATAQVAEPSFVVVEDQSSEPADGQDTLLCNEEYPECVWVREEAALTSEPEVLAPDDEPASEEGTMMLEWREVPAFGSPPPPVGDCSRTARALLDKASSDFMGNNPNKVLENIDWYGLTSETADPLIDSMLALMGPGQWEHQEVVASYGEVDPQQVRNARRTLRWVLSGSAQTFVLRERLGCWLLSPAR